MENNSFNKYFFLDILPTRYPTYWISYLLDILPWISHLLDNLPTGSYIKYPTNWISYLLDILPTKYPTYWISYLLDILSTGYPTYWISYLLDVLPNVYSTYWISYILDILHIGYPTYWISYLLNILPTGYHTYWISYLLDIIPTGYHTYWIAYLLNILPTGYPTWISSCARLNTVGIRPSHTSRKTSLSSTVILHTLESIYIIYTLLICQSVCMFVCLFVTDKSQVSSTDWAQTFCGTSRDPWEGLWMLRNTKNCIQKNCNSARFYIIVSSKRKWWKIEQKLKVTIEDVRAVS